MTYATSDLHGYPLDSFLRLLEKAGFSDSDVLYVLGDVIDRNGDGGIAMLRWMMSRPNVEFILGNHEAMMLSCTFLFEEITDENVDRLTFGAAAIADGMDAKRLQLHDEFPPDPEGPES